MQRLLTVLVLVLLIAVAALGIAVYNLGDNNGASARQAPAARPPTPLVDVAAAHAAEQDAKITALKEEVAILSRQLRDRLAAPAASPGPVATGGGGAGEGGSSGLVAAPGVRARDASGELIVTEEDAEFFAKVQEQVLRQQRIDNQTRSVMLRIDRIASRGEMAPLAGDHRRDVEKILKRYVAAGDDLTARLLRNPDDEVRDLSNEQRRDELTRSRTELVAAAQRELESILGPEDAKKVAEESLQRPWGLGRQNRRFESNR